MIYDRHDDVPCTKYADWFILNFDRAVGQWSRWCMKKLTKPR